VRGTIKIDKIIVVCIMGAVVRPVLWPGDRFDGDYIVVLYDNRGVFACTGGIKSGHGDDHRSLTDITCP
jgi:hypothetical protein